MEILEYIKAFSLEQSDSVTFLFFKQSFDLTHCQLLMKDQVILQSTNIVWWFFPKKTSIYVLAVFACISIISKGESVFLRI